MKLKSLEDLMQAELTVTRMGQQLNVSVFYIDGLLIDTGPYRKKDELVALFEQWDIEQVILTHHHEDHTGMAYWLAKETDIPVFMHRLGIEDCKRKVRLPFYRYATWGKRMPFSAEALGEVFRTNQYTWEVIHSPGHAHDHVALYNQEKKWMFGGDLYVSPKPKSMYRFESAPQLIQSLRKILAYDFEVYICSHAGILFDGKALLQKKLQYLIELQQKVLFMHNDGMSAKQIQQKLFPKKHFMHYVSLFENSPKHLVHSFLAGF